MMNIKNKIFPLVLTVLFSFSGILALHSEVVSRVVAEVNGEIVTSQELDQILRPLYSKYKRVYSGDDLAKRMEDARKDAISQLIERKLVLQEAKKKSVQVDEKDIETRLKQIRSKFDSDDEFYYALEREGMSLDQLRENIQEQLLVRTLTRQQVAGSASVTPKEITDYYNEHVKTRFSEPEMVQTGQILVKKGKEKETKDLAYQKIQEVKAKLKQGIPFETVAKEYSEGPYAKEGGNLPFFAKGDLMKEIEEAVFSMEVGQTSDIIESDLGYHILVLKARKKDRVKPLSEVWPEIEDELFQKKLQEVHKKWVDELKKKAYIQIY